MLLQLKDDCMPLSRESFEYHYTNVFGIFDVSVVKTLSVTVIMYALLFCLLHCQGIDFDLGAVTVDPQTPSYDPSPLKLYLAALGVPYFYESQCEFTPACPSVPVTLTMGPILSLSGSVRMVMSHSLPPTAQSVPTAAPSPRFISKVTNNWHKCLAGLCCAKYCTGSKNTILSLNSG